MAYEFTLVPATEFAERVKPVKKEKADPFKELFEALKNVPAGQVVAAAVPKTEGKTPDRVAKTMAQSFITAGRRRGIPVNAQRSIDNTVIYITLKTQTAEGGAPAPASGNLVVMFKKGTDNNLVLVNGQEVITHDAELYNGLTSYLKAPYALMKGNMVKFLNKKGIAFVEQ